MKNLNVIKVVSMLMIGIMILSACNSEPKESNTNNQVVKSEEASSKPEQATESRSGEVIAQYLELKDALVADNTEATALLSKELLTALEGFNLNHYKGDDKAGLTKIIEQSKELAKQLLASDIATQRAQFLNLSKNLIELVRITGTPVQLYQQYCPMYNNNQGGVWLSAQKEIKNPYFGASMLHCGVIQKEIRG